MGQRPMVAMQNSNTQQQASQQLTSEPTTHQFEFNGNAGEYFKIWIVNICLTLVTVGIYSAWAKVRTNRYFYSNTILAGATFDYLAKPQDILKGRAIAVGFFVLYSLFTQVNPASGLLFAAAFVFLVPWVVGRALMFRARNTAYRNVRFNFKSNYSDAMQIFILFPILIIFTLGLILPYIVYLQKRFIVENSFFGNTKFDFDGQAKEFYRVALIAGVVTVLGVIIAVLIPVAGIIIMYAAYLYAYAYFQANIWNLAYGSSSLGENGFSCSFETKDLLILYVTNSIAILLSLGLLIPWAKIRMAKYKAEHMQFHAVQSLDSFLADNQVDSRAVGEEIGEAFGWEVAL